MEGFGGRCVAYCRHIGRERGGVAHKEQEKAVS